MNLYKGDQGQRLTLKLIAVSIKPPSNHLKYRVYILIDYLKKYTAIILINYFKKYTAIILINYLKKYTAYIPINNF